jgi:hypothetical protein
LLKVLILSLDLQLFSKYPDSSLTPQALLQFSSVRESDHLVVAEGTPEEIAENKRSYTGIYLKKHIK